MDVGGKDASADVDGEKTSTIDFCTRNEGSPSASIDAPKEGEGRNEPTRHKRRVGINISKPSLMPEFTNSSCDSHAGGSYEDQHSIRLFRLFWGRSRKGSHDLALDITLSVIALIDYETTYEREEWKG